MSYPRELEYDENHHWSRIQNDGNGLMDAVAYGPYVGDNG